MRTNRLLLVEDDAELGELLTEALTDEGYHVDHAPRRAARAASGADPAVRRDGHRPAAARAGRPRPARPAALAGGAGPGADAHRAGAVDDRVAGLDAGADDYLAKPFDLDELQRPAAGAVPAHAVAGRAPAGSAPAGSTSPRATWCWPDGTRVALSAREFELLRVLAARPAGVHSRAELRRRVFDEAAAASIVDTYVYYLRRKLGRAVVRTVHGLGYRLGGL